MQDFFMSTLRVNIRVINSVVLKMNSESSVDLRGKHKNYHSLSPDIRQFINAIRRIKSHYLCSQTPREFFNFTVSDLFAKNLDCFIEPGII